MGEILLEIFFFATYFSVFAYAQSGLPCNIPPLPITVDATPTWNASATRCDVLVDVHGSMQSCGGASNLCGGCEYFFSDIEC